jgi:hypothetical protein
MTEAVVDLKLSIGEVSESEAEEAQEQLGEPLEALRARDEELIG